MTRLRSILVFTAMLASVAALVASGDENTAKKSDDSGDQAGVGSAEVFKLGDAVDLGDWQVKAHGFTDPVVVAADSMFAPAEGLKRVMIDAEVTNNSDKPASVSSIMCFDLKDGENKTYSQTIGESNVGSIDGEVAAGASLRGEMVYDVPSAATGFVMGFKCDLLSSGSATIQMS